MRNFQSVDEVLDFAIKGEEMAADFYTRLAEKVSQPGMANLFKDFAEQEKGHKAMLEEVKQGATLQPSEQKIQDMKIAEYTVDISVDKNLDYQEALLLAMKREKAAYKLYNTLAEHAQDDRLRQTFEALAQEEAKHKLSIEIEYDDNVLGQN
jgi:rubrerythrin